MERRRTVRRKGWLEVRRKRHGVIWWLLIGWWERPMASILWYLLAAICGNKGVRYYY